MFTKHSILALLERSESGTTLPQPFYRDPEIFQFDVSAVFAGSWLHIGFEAELAAPGAHLALTIAGNPIVVVRGQGGAIRGFHNTCRHRGSQICPDGHGRSSKLICPYHKWTYDWQGRLIGAGRMPEDFEFAAHSLKSIAVEVAAGCIYVCLGENPPDFAPFREAMVPLVAPFRLANTKLAFENALVEKANWKLVMENARECYHCSTSHPELRRCFPVSIKPGFDFGDDEHTLHFKARMAQLWLSTTSLAGTWWHAGRYPLNPGIDSISADGQAVVNRRLIDIPDREIGGVRWATEPNSFCHVLPDYCFMFAAYPVAPEETVVISKWLVHKDAVEGADYDVERLTETWNKTNLQDRELAENNQRGVNGMGYSPGAYSRDAEDFVIRFSNWYRDAARAAALKGAQTAAEA